MARQEKEYLKDLWDRRICPTCGKSIDKIVGNGKKSEGGFCSLDCYTKYHASNEYERMKQLLSAIKN
jgi:hypothetical protein